MMQNTTILLKQIIEKASGKIGRISMLIKYERNQLYGTQLLCPELLIVFAKDSDICLTANLYTR